MKIYNLKGGPVFGGLTVVPSGDMATTSGTSPTEIGDPKSIILVAVSITDTSFDPWLTT